MEIRILELPSGAALAWEFPNEKKLAYFGRVATMYARVEFADFRHDAIGGTPIERARRFADRMNAR